MSAKTTEIQRSMETFRGIIEGIIANEQVNADELGALESWASNHRTIAQVYPVSEALSLSDQILADGFVSPEESREFCDWATLMLRQLGQSGDETAAAVSELHGYLNGIAADEIVDRRELESLQRWLNRYDSRLQLYPFAEAAELVNDILADGVVTAEERDRFLRFAYQFAERPTESQEPGDSIYYLPWMQNDSPIVDSIDTLFDAEGVDRVAGRSFCLTGQAESGTRKELEARISDNGGTISSVTKSLDYLVIGAKSSPAWRYATYGRKIERVMNYRKAGVTTKIASERHLVVRFS